MTTSVIERLMDRRILMLGETVDDGIANQLVAQLLLLSSDDARSDICLYINSPGGSVMAGLAIYDTTSFVEPDVATLWVGQAISTAAVLLAAGAPGKRRVLPHARVLLHQPHTEGSRGSISDLALEAAELARIRAEAEGLHAEHTGHTVERVRADTDRALVLAGQAAVDYSVADEVLTRAPKSCSRLVCLLIGGDDVGSEPSPIGDVVAVVDCPRPHHRG